ARSAIEVAHQQGVDREQRGRADDTAGERGVVADDGVLHRVRQRQQNHQVERVELSQDPLAERAQRDDEQEIDGNRPDDFLQHRDGQAAGAELDEIDEEAVPLRHDLGAYSQKGRRGAGYRSSPRSRRRMISSTLRFDKPRCCSRRTYDGSTPWSRRRIRESAGIPLYPSCAIAPTYSV